MPLESGTQIQELNAAWPTGVDPKSEGDDHIRLVKRCVQGSFPGMSAPWTTSEKMKANGYDASGAPVENVGAPVNNDDAATKAITDSLDQRVTANEGDINTLDSVVADHELRINDLEAKTAYLTSFGHIEGSTGNVLGGSGDFSCNRIDDGEYRITFNNPATSTLAQSLVASCMFNVFFDNKEPNIDYVSPNTIDVYMANSGTQLQDQDFTFQRVANT